MHSLETGIIVSIAAFFFLSFFTFVFLRENSISTEIKEKLVVEKNAYSVDRIDSYKPELMNNILNIIIEGEKEYVGETE